MVLDLVKKARSLGFISVGISRPRKPAYFDQFCEWIVTGKQGDMRWMEKHLDLRRNPEKLLDGCKTIISLAYPYSSTKPLTTDGYSVARYSEPKQKNYHDRLKKLSKVLAESLHDKYTGCRTRVCIDSAPILERSFAYASGMGFIGKNNSLIIPGHGSYVFLAEILTTAQISQPAISPIKNQCGSCNACLDACPTGALEAPYCLDASKCLSYLTIEHRGEFEGPGVEKMGKCFFGCDVCQEVCPFNRDDGSKEILLPSTNDILEMEEHEFKSYFGKSAFNRAGLNKLKSNIRAVKTKNC